MSQENQQITKVEISMRKLLQYSNTTVNAGADAGKNYLARNLNCMKKWSSDEIFKIFNGEGRLIGVSGVRKQRKSLLTANNPTARADMVKNTRKLVIAALKLVFGEEKLKNSEFEMPRKHNLKWMANKLISERGILNKFDSRIVVEYWPQWRSCSVLESWH